MRTAGADSAQLDTEFTGQLAYGRACVNLGARLGWSSSERRSRCGEQGRQEQEQRLAQERSQQRQQVPGQRQALRL